MGEGVMSWASGKVKIAFLVLALLFAWVLIFSITRAKKLGGPHVSLGVLSFTNDAAGVCFGRFSITNLDATPVMVLSSMIVTNQLTGLAGYSVSPAISGVNLNLGQSKIIAFPAPTNQIPWKLKVFYIQYPAMRRGFWGTTVILIDLIRGGGKIVAMQHEIESDWIGGTTNTVLAP